MVKVLPKVKIIGQITLVLIGFPAETSVSNNNAIKVMQKPINKE